MESPRDPLPAYVSAEPLPPSEADLIAACRAGDAAAYDTLYRRHVTAAHGLARQLVRNRAEADDVVAETVAKILDLLHRGGGPGSAPAEAWVTEVLDVANALQAAGMLGKPSVGRLLH
jgi:hypothetical protein